MKKSGFTLAEVLITLGIIGVVAALTAPALTKNTGQAKTGPILSKFVNTWETAMEAMFSDEAADKISNMMSLASGGQGLLFRLSKYMIMTPLYSNSNTQLKEYRYHMSDGSGSMSVVSAFQLKDGSIIWIVADNNAKYDAKSSYKGGIGNDVYIDINGFQGNNRLGREVFAFLVDESGTLVPYGGNAHKYLVAGAKDYKCATNSSSKSNSMSCTGQIADNNWKAPDQ